MPADRIRVEEYAMFLAHVAALRSEDVRRVGAVALDADNRVIGTAYNGLAPKFTAPPRFFERENPERLMSVIHAEANLCSHFVRGQASLVATTLSPCGPCAKFLIAHGVKRVIYGMEYERDQSAREIFNFYKIPFDHVPLDPCQVENLKSILAAGGVAP